MGNIELAVDKKDIYYALNIMCAEEENCEDVKLIYHKLCKEVSEGKIKNEKELLLGRANEIFVNFLEDLSNILKESIRKNGGRKND